MNYYDCKISFNLKFCLIIIFFILDIFAHITFCVEQKRFSTKINKNVISNDFINVEDLNSKLLNQIKNRIKNFIEITNEEQKFLNGMIRKLKPKKIVEIGVAYGGTAALILNAIKDIDDAKLYSIDINKYCYKLHSKETGFLVRERFPELMNKWKIYTGGITSEFIEKIGNNIDLVYIDTVHYTPGEMINWLEILPFLKEEGFVILHDTFYMYYNDKISRTIQNFSNNQILCYIRGELILPKYNSNTFSMNIGAIKLSKNQDNYYLQYFMALGTQWHYIPSERELNVLKKFFNKYYGEKYVKIFDDAIEKNKARFIKKSNL